MSFVTLSKDQFEEYLPNGFEIVSSTYAKEFIYDLQTTNKDINVRVYSSVDIHTKQTRDLGTDAVRVVFWDKLNDRPIGKGKRINRVEGKTTIGERIQSRIQVFMETAHDQTIIDFEYVKAILNSSTVNWIDFAKSLLEGLKKYKSLTGPQLAYVIGENNPKGKPTFEAQVKVKDPNFLNKYLDSLKEEDDGTDDRRGNSRNDTFPTEKPRIPNIKRQESSFHQSGITGGKSERTYGKDFKKYKGSEVKLISTEGYPYPFDFFNPVQSLVYPHRKEDKNFIVSASTSSGKTVAAEIIMEEIMKKRNLK